MKRIIKRTLAGVFGLAIAGACTVLIIKQVKGEGIDLFGGDWSVNFIPGNIITILLFCIPVMLGVYMVIYGITGQWPKNK